MKILLETDLLKIILYPPNWEPGWSCILLRLDSIQGGRAPLSTVTVVQGRGIVAEALYILGQTVQYKVKLSGVSEKWKRLNDKRCSVSE